MIYIGVIGAHSCGREIGGYAYRAGKAIAEAGAVLVCGGMGGVMSEACRGAADGGGISIGILPGSSREMQNRYLTYSVTTGIGEARNSIVVGSSDAVITIDGSYGTLSEIAFALKAGKPVAGVKTWNLRDGDGSTAPIVYFDEPEKAVRWAINSVGK